MRTIYRSEDVKLRKSPSISATVYPVGYKMIGNDGNMWQIARDSRGVQRWQKIGFGGYDMPEQTPKKAKAPKPQVVEEKRRWYCNHKDQKGCCCYENARRG